MLNDFVNLEDLRTLPIDVNPANAQPARGTASQTCKSTPISPDSVRPQGMLSVPRINPSEASHAVDAHEAFPKLQNHGDRSDSARLTGDGLVPKTDPQRCGRGLAMSRRRRPGPQIRGDPKEIQGIASPKCACFSNTCAKRDE